MEEEQIKLIRTFVLINLLINDIEEPNKVPTKEIKEIYDALKQVISPLEKIIDKVYAVKEIRNTTFIQVLENKFNYHILREAKRLFKICKQVKK